jgi:hypothetical protein
MARNVAKIEPRFFGVDNGIPNVPFSVTKSEDMALPLSHFGTYIICWIGSLGALATLESLDLIPVSIGRVAHRP